MSSINEFIELFSDVWKKGIFGVNASEIIVGFVIFLLFYVLRRLFARFVILRLNKIVSKSKTSIDDTIVKVIEGPLKFFPVVIGFFIASSYVELSNNIQNFIDLINRTLIIKSFEQKLTAALVDWTLKGLKIVVIILGVVAILELWGIKVGPVIAGLGLFGVAVALGAQDLFKNLISGIMILMERRFLIGDVIHVSGEAEGTVEQIGFRSTLIRQFDSNVVTVPNFKFAEQSVTNHSRRIHRRIRWIIGLEYRTNIEQLKNIRTNIKNFIDENDFFANDGSSYYKSSFVRIENFSDSSIDMLVECFTKTSEWVKFIEIKEKLAIKIKEIVEKEKAGFAFPSQSLYVESFPYTKPDLLNEGK